MIRTKQQADSHVAAVLKQLKGEREKQLRGYQFARLYADIKEYEVAKRHLLAFLAVKDNSAAAYGLLGQIYESQLDSARAVDAYKRSLELDPSQPNLLVKVCELYDEINISPDTARFWAEKLERVSPSHDVIRRLREKAITSRAGDSSPELLDLYAAESAQHPHDAVRRIRLLELLVRLGRTDAAYSQACDVEAARLYVNNLPWYSCLVNVLEAHVKEAGSRPDDALFHRQYLSALDTKTALSIEQAPNITDSMRALWSMDVEMACRYTPPGGAGVLPRVDGDAWTVFYRQMEAQYLLHAGTLILNRAQKDRLGWREASDLAAACFLVSYSVSPPCLKAAWFARASDTEKGVYRHWHAAACLRCSQTGHMLNTLLKDHLLGGDRQRWVDRLQQEYCHQQGKEKLFQVLFTLPQHKDARDSSYVLRSALLASFRPLMPDSNQLCEFDAGAMSLKADILQCAVWTGLQYYSIKDRTQPHYTTPVFESLEYDAPNLLTASPESLSQLDVKAFLLAAVYCAAVRQEERASLRRSGGDAYRPALLPLAINELLCTREQSEWWESAYKLHTSTAREKLGHLRAVLQRGIETVRLVGPHGMGIDLIVHLARNFAEQLEAVRSEESSTAAELAGLRARVLHYWTRALDLLNKLDK